MKSTASNRYVAMTVFFSVLKFWSFYLASLALGSILRWCCLIFGWILGILKILSKDILMFYEELLHGMPHFECHPTANPSCSFLSGLSSRGLTPVVHSAPTSWVLDHLGSLHQFWCVWAGAGGCDHRLGGGLHAPHHSLALIPIRNTPILGLEFLLLPM